MNRISKALFGDGISFLLPGVALCGLFFLFNVDPQLGKPLLLGLHGLTLLLFAHFLAKYTPSPTRGDGLFWGAVMAALILPGAFLEFPSDPWEHVYRTFSWSTLSHWQEHREPLRFSYFWAWTWLDWLPVAWRRTGLDGLSAAAQLLVLVQVYRLALQLGETKEWARLHTAVFLVTFGTSVFGLRYYALSSMPFAYSAYLALLHRLLSPKPWSLSSLLHCALLLGFLGVTHYQELVFAVIAIVAVTGVTWARRQIGAKRLIQIALGVFLLGLATGPLWHWAFPAAYARLGPEHFTWLGTVKIWDRMLRLTDTWGVHGCLAVLFALYGWKRRPETGTLTLLPLVLVLFPPTVFLIIQRVTVASDLYRLIYLFPTSFWLVFGLRRLLATKWKRQSAVLAATAAACLALSLSPALSWRGRLWFQLHPSPPIRSLEFLDSTADWLAANRSYEKDCFLIGDDPTMYGIHALSGTPLLHFWKQRNLRLKPNAFGLVFIDPVHIEYVIWHQALCGVLVTQRQDLPETPPSAVARLSNHWGEEQADLHQTTLPEAQRVTERYLKESGWIRTPVPPFYHLWEPPLPPGPFDRLRK